MFFVWTKGLRGPCPERWPAILQSTTTGKPAPYLAAFKLQDSEILWPLDMLAVKYPPPTSPES